MKNQKKKMTDDSSFLIVDFETMTFPEDIYDDNNNKIEDRFKKPLIKKREASNSNLTTIQNGGNDGVRMLESENISNNSRLKNFINNTTNMTKNTPGHRRSNSTPEKNFAQFPALAKQLENEELTFVSEMQVGILCKKNKT